MLFSDPIDLHLHSNISDGTDTPLEILGLAREEGLGLFSLTDHDAINGSEEILQQLADEADSGNPLFLPGVEFSCGDELGKYHILGYGYDPSSEGIKRVVRHGRALRMEKLQGRLDFLKEKFGFDFSPEDLEKLRANYNPGKPHIANMMVRYGYAPDKGTAIQEYINQKKFPKQYVKPEEAIQGILDGGGIPVLAHPSYGDGDQIIVGEDMRLRLQRLMDFGLQGVEAYYSGFTPALQKELLRLADEYHLLVTAGSDYHGKNKMIRIGDTNLDHTAEGADGLQRFLDLAVEKSRHTTDR